MLRPFLRSLAAAAILAVASFLMSVLTARALTVEERGVYAAVMLIAALSAGLSQLGLGPSFVFLFRSNPAAKPVAFVLKASVLVLLVSGALSSILASFNPAVSSTFFVEIVCLALGASGLMLVAAMSQIDKGLVAFNLIRISLPVIMLFVTVAMWRLAAIGVRTILIAQIVVSTLLFLWSLLWLLNLARKGRSARGKPNLYIRQGATLGLKYHAITALGIVATNVDKVFLYAGGTLAEFGLYSVAIASSRLLGAVQESLSNAIFSSHAGEAGKNLTYGTLLSFRLSTYPLLAIALVLSLCADALIGGLFGAAYREAALPFSILCFDSVVAGGSWVLAQHFTAAGRPGIVLLRQALSLIPLIALLPFLPTTNTITWLALALLTASIARLAISIVMLRRDTGAPIGEFLPSWTDASLLCRKYKKVIRAT